MSIVAPNHPFLPGIYGARGGIPLGALQAASEHTRLLLLEVTTVGAKEAKIEIEVGGVRVTNNLIPATVAESREVPFAIIIPAGEQWKINGNAGIKEAFGNLLNLS